MARHLVVVLLPQSVVGRIRRWVEPVIGSALTLNTAVLLRYVPGRRGADLGSLLAAVSRNAPASW